MKEVKIFFPQYSRKVFALPGTSLFECIARAGILIRTPCGGAGTCGKCRVKLVGGEMIPSSDCSRHFSKQEIDEGYRLACRCRVESDISIEIPETTLFETGTVTLGAEESSDDESGGLEIPLADSCMPLVEKRRLKIPQPTLENPVADLDNIRKQTGDIEISLDDIRKLPLFLRENNFEVNLVFSDKRIIAFEKCDHSDKISNYAVAVDIGTTTIAVALVDIPGRKQLGSCGALNPQVKYGEDVLSRICAQGESDEKRSAMAQCVIDVCNKLIEELLVKQNIAPENVYAVSIAGNTVMQSLFLSVPVQPLGEIPFAPPFSETLRLTASDIGLSKVHSNAEIVLFPVLGGFVGGDITAGMVASGLTEKHTNEVVLFVDVGTNGEIVLLKDGKFFATAAAAGPAFEGAGIEFGMRAGKGAIEKILIEDGELRYNVIGNVPPKGICGTALIDIAAELLKCGILDETGRILSAEESEEAIASQYDSSGNLLNRIIPSGSDSDSRDFIIARSKESENGKPILLTQKDVRNLQLAGGAIKAAITILLKNAGISESDIDKLYIAGGFGNYIRRTHAKRIGMIPDIPDCDIFFIGNTSLIGAKTVLFCRGKLFEAENIAAEVDVVDVSLDMEFQIEFANAMIFPAK